MGQVGQATDTQEEDVRRVDNVYNLIEETINLFFNIDTSTINGLLSFKRPIEFITKHLWWF